MKNNSKDKNGLQSLNELQDLFNSLKKEIAEKEDNFILVPKVDKTTDVKSLDGQKIQDGLNLVDSLLEFLQDDLQEEDMIVLIKLSRSLTPMLDKKLQKIAERLNSINKEQQHLSYLFSELSEVKSVFSIAQIIQN